MAKHRRLKLSTDTDSEPILPLRRWVAGLGVLVALGLLVMQVGGLVLEDEEPQSVETVAEAPVVDSEVPELRVRALENVGAKVEIDGETVFEGTLSGGTLRTWPAGKVTAVELDDLTRASVAYDGKKVQPLGSLNTARRLEFIDDL